MMQYVSRKAVEGAIHKIFLNNAKDTEISVDVLINSLIEEFNSQEFTQEQKSKLGQYIFFNSDVMKQLEQSEEEAENDYIANYDEYLRYKKEVTNESR